MKNCTFGNWTFTEVQHVVITNCSNSIAEGFSTTLNFKNSSGLIENITLKDLKFSTLFEGLIVQNYSNINITKSNFVNNIVSYGLIKVLNSSTLLLLNSSLQQNQGIDFGGAIYVLNSVVRILNTTFSNNKAVRGGGGICALSKSILWITNSTFENNYILIEDSGSNRRIPQYGGGAIYFESASVVEMHNVNFTNNSANLGAAIYFILDSKFYSHNMFFGKNTGSAIYGYKSVNFSCKNCLFYQNMDTNYKFNSNGATVLMTNDSIINISGVTCENNIGNISSCISADTCSVTIYNSTFGFNTGSIIALLNSLFFMANSSFFNNSTPSLGGTIFSYNSTLHISDSVFYHNKVIGSGGALNLWLSVATVNNCTFFNNSNSAVSLVANTTILILSSIFEHNYSIDIGGALLVGSFSVANVSNSTFLKNGAMYGGAVQVGTQSLLVISHCLFSKNSATAGEGTLKIKRSELNLIHSLNRKCCSGGSIDSIASSLLIHHTVFENNTASVGGGAITSIQYS